MTILAHHNFSAVDETDGRRTLTYVRKFLSVFIEYMKNSLLKDGIMDKEKHGSLFIFPIDANELVAEHDC